MNNILNKLFGISLALLCIFLLTGCLFGGNLVDDSKATIKGTEITVNGNNQFAIDMYKELSPGNKNMFFSPYSISTALAMTYEGAHKETAIEMEKVLHFDKDDETRRYSFARLHNKINVGSNEYELSSANALWAQEDYPFLQEYIDINSNYYGSKVTNLDFADDSENSRQLINKWVEDKTNDKIINLIPSGAIDSSTRLVLTNAIYFNGKWLIEFDEKNTISADFWITPQKMAKVKMMTLSGPKANFNYAENDDLQLLEMPYDGEEVSMLILLPKKYSLDNVEESLTANVLIELKKNLSNQNVKVNLPKFTFESKYMLKDVLSNMGMPTAFSSDADFSKMDGTKNLQITKVIHQAFIDVNEEGTEAAAATAVIVSLKSAAVDNIEFKVDRPFIFLIEEKETGQILFMGKVTDPRSTLLQ